MIYLDYHATTPCDPRVVDAMLPYFRQFFGNPSSADHRPGRIAAEAVDTARARIAALIGAHPREIVFTSGATESNNLAILGVADAARGDRKRIVTSAIEHKAILAPCEQLRSRGYDVVVLPVDRDGTVSLDATRAAITDDTLLVSVHAANNEVGTLQSIAEIATLAHTHGALMHTDAAQAVGKIPVDVDAWDVDLLSISAHKLYGPKGIGALYVRDGARNHALMARTFGGGQEWDIRPGTLNVPGIVGFGVASQICAEEFTDEAARIAELRDLLEDGLFERIPDARRNGALDKRLPGNSSLTFPGIEAHALLANLPNLALSTGSACTSGAPEPSHVLQALGLMRDDASATIRVGLGRFTTRDEITGSIHEIAEAYAQLRTFSPVR